MRGELGLPLAALDADALDDLRTQLTIVTKPWDDNPAETVYSYREEDGHIWIPRYFKPRVLWQLVAEWDWTLGEPYTFTPTGKLDPERGQVAAVPTMVSHVRANSGGLLVAPTGTGKTCMGLRIAASFGRYIGIPVYAGHMIDHWIEDIGKFLGLGPDDIGVVQGERCELGKPVTIMMIQSLLARGYPQQLYDQIGFLLLDEVNHFGAPQWKDTVAQFAARYRLGLSADPRRKDGLGPIISWVCGSVGHSAKRQRSKDVQPPKVIGIRWGRSYNHAKFCKWERGEGGEWEPGEAHNSKYDNVLAADKQRNAAIAQEIYNAAIVGRQIIVFSSRVEHLAELRQRVRRLLDPMSAVERLALLRPPPPGLPVTSQLTAGMKKEADRARVVRADVIFTTYPMARDAFNKPALDTECFATPPGNWLQPVGRLREKAEGYDRRELLIMYWFEDTPHSKKKWLRSRDEFRQNDMPVEQVDRFPPKVPK